MPKPPPLHVALLRGVNVGGKNKLPMKDLAALFTAAGCQEVRTYIASGNVIFRDTPARARKVSGKLAAAIENAFGLRVPVLVRSAEALRAAASGNPFLERGVAPDHLFLMFLADEPTPALVRALAPGRSPPDEFVVRGREVYLSCPNGAAKTKLTNAWFDKTLATVSTGRNWRTVRALVALLDGY